MWLGIVTFGDSETFDRLYIGVLIFTAVICRKNINVLGVIVILAIDQLLAESVWFIYNKEFLFPSLVTGIIFYSAAVYASYSFRHDKMSMLLTISILVTVATEINSYLETGSIAALHWYIAVLSITLFIRHLIFLRVSYTESYSTKKAHSINLDWQIYKLNAFAVFIQTANLIEYALRKIFGLSDVLFVYNLYPFLLQAISTYMVFIIFHESYKLIIPRLLRA